MAGSDSPRDKFKRDVLDALAASGFLPPQLDVVARALDDKTTDALFTRATTSGAVTALPGSLAMRVTEWYYADAANAFAGRESQHGTVKVQGPVYGPVTGGDIIAGAVIQTGGAARDVVIGWADMILHDLEVRGREVKDGRQLRDDLRDATAESLPERLGRFVRWAKGRTLELTGVGLSIVGLMVQYLETLKP